MIDSGKSSKFLIIATMLTITGGGVAYIKATGNTQNQTDKSLETRSNTEGLVLEKHEARLPEFMRSGNSEFVMDDNFFTHDKLEEQEPLEEVLIEDDPKPKPSTGKFTKHSEETTTNQLNLSDVIAFKETKLPEVQEEHPQPVVEKPVIHVPEAKNVSSPKGFNRFIAQEVEERAEEKLAKFLSDEENPTKIASQPFDLSRVVTTDTFIPAVMYTAVNSEIPSKTVLAVVESDVVGFHGRNILIPKGSKIEGVYEQLSSKTSRRMQIAWFKITRPDGIIIKLDNAESGDQQGASGLTGYLDQRLKDRYGAAMLLSLINAGAQMSVNSNNLNQLAAIESFSRESATLTAQIIRENINTMPVIMIRQGARFNIRPLQNIYFPEIKSGSGFVEASLIKS